MLPSFSCSPLLLLPLTYILPTHHSRAVTAILHHSRCSCCCCEGRNQNHTTRFIGLRKSNFRGDEPISLLSDGADGCCIGYRALELLLVEPRTVHEKRLRLKKSIVRLARCSGKSFLQRAPSICRSTEYQTPFSTDHIKLALHYQSINQSIYMIYSIIYLYIL